MAVIDQKWRTRLQKALGHSDMINTKKLGNKILAIDKKHAEELRRIIKKYGWPTISLVGKKSSHLAWLLAQHSDHDRKFQEVCLNLLKEAVKKNDASPINFVYLNDRIKVAQNKPQLFGTQFKRNINGTRIPFPIYKPSRVDKRRKKYGLGSLEKNIKMISKIYKYKGGKK